MSSFCSSIAVRRLVAGLAVLATGLVGPGGEGISNSPVSRAEAANYRIRSITIGRATQYFRSDRTISAPRIFTQGLSVWGYDLLDDHTGSLNLHVSIRYNTDFSLTRTERDNPYFADQWNELSLDLAYLDWRPSDTTRLRFGRQWSHGALGVRDFDGVLAMWRPRVGPGTHAHFELYGGHDIQTAFGEFDTAQWDVQGLPPDDSLLADRLDGFHLLAGGSTGMQWGADASLEVSYRRRWAVGVDSAVDGADTVVGSERVGAAASASVHPRLAVSAYGSIHSMLEDVDRAGAQMSWQVPGLEGIATGGVEHRHPWFDSSSIFNLFGPRAYQSAFGIYQFESESLRTEFGVRGWGRIYHGDDDAVAAGVDAQNERAVGGALNHLSRLKFGEKSVHWHSLLSYQTSIDRGTDQFLADSRVRMPLLDQDLYLSARGLFLAAMTDNPRFNDEGYALTGVLGLDVPVSTLGTLSGAIETSGGNFYPTQTSVYATFAVEHWP